MQSLSENEELLMLMNGVYNILSFPKVKPDGSPMLISLHFF